MVAGDTYRKHLHSWTLSKPSTALAKNHERTSSYFSTDFPMQVFADQGTPPVKRHNYGAGLINVTTLLHTTGRARHAGRLGSTRRES